MLAIKNILVATDFSAPSGVALAYGRDLARTYRARLHVLHVVEDLTLRYAEIGFGPTDLQKNLEDVAIQDLNAVITEDDRSTLRAVPVIETHVGAASGICEYARKNEIDLIVTGTHGRGAVQHLLMGSVAERLVRTAPCPVLTVRMHERDFVAITDVAAPAAAA